MTDFSIRIAQLLSRVRAWASGRGARRLRGSAPAREGVQAMLAREPDFEVVGTASDYDGQWRDHVSSRAVTRLGALTAACRPRIDRRSWLAIREVDLLRASGLADKMIVVRWGDRRRVWVYVVLTVIALSACGPGRGSTLGPRRHLELAAGAQGRAAAPVAAAAGPLAPGKYYTSLFEPTFTYTVGDGWGLVAETDGLVFLGRDVGSERQGLIVTIVSPTKADTLVLRDPIYRPEQSPRSDLRRSLPMPDDYIAYLAQQDELTVSEVEPATLLGREGTVASVAVTDRPGGLPCPPTVPCLALLLEQQPEVTRHGFFAGERERVWDLGAGNDRLIVMVRISATVADSSDQLLQDALGVLATVSFA